MKNEFKITRELMQSWVKSFHFNSTRNILMLIVACYLSIYGALWCADTYYLLGYHIIYYPDYLLLLILFSFISLFFLHYIFIRPTTYYKRMYKECSHIYDLAEWTRTIEFTDDEIIYTDHTSSFRYKYKSVKKIRERRNEVIINLEYGVGVRIYKDAFVEGNWADCKKLINEKRKKR